ncbi:MAG: hypothetical protein GY810_02230 [Aureispira sp.]|nr:hypothetical protein [Aureispira sp.]
MSIYKPFLLISIFFTYITACVSPHKLVEQQKFDVAIQKLTKKFRNNKNRPADLVQLLEQAYFEAMGNDLTTITDLKDEHNAENWDKIAAIYNQIDQRQQLIQPLLPLVDENKKEAHIALIDVSAKKKEAKQEATKFHYYKGIALLDSAQSSNSRFIAREAHEHFLQARQYLSDYVNQDLESYIKTSADLGTTYVFIQWEDEWPVQLLDEFYLKAISDLDDYDWILFYTTADERLEPNYTITLRTTSHEVSHEGFEEQSYTDSRDVEDGTEIVYDQNGKPLKDENGKTVTRPKIINVSCRVKEMRQYRSIRLITEFELEDNMQDLVIYEEDLRIFHEFDNRYISYNGDRRALSDAHEDMLGNNREIYPDEDEMTILAAEQLRYLVEDVWDDQASANDIE